MAEALALGGFLALLGGALYLMWSPPHRHKHGGNDAGSAGGDGAWSGDSHHGHSGDSGGAGSDGGGGDGS